MAVAAALAAAVTLAACGGGGSGGPKAPSALDPANMVPATSVAYVSVTVRPQGTMKSDLIEAIDSIAGRGTGQKLGAELRKSFGTHWSEMKPWLGQRVGIAVLSIPQTQAGLRSIGNDVVGVATTSDPAATRRFMTKHPNVLGNGVPWKVVGHYVLMGILMGSTNAIGQAEATTPKTSLASDPAFKADMTELGNHELFIAYASLHQLYQQLLPLLRSLPNSSGSTFSQAAKQAPPGSSVALGMSALHNQFRLDVIQHGMPHTSAPATGVATDVSALPASSWLALTLGGSLTKSGAVTKLAASVSKSLSTLQAAQGITGRVPSGPLRFVEQDLLPALGPVELSVSGSSHTTLQAGLVMDPVNKRAGARLARAVKRLVRGLPVSASTVGGRVAVTFGFSNLQQLLNPSSKLAGNPTFKRALAQLPAGARAGLYLNFSGIAALASLDPSAAGSPTMRVLHRLDYLIAGGTHSHFRLVLATH